ncbi:hypothetical protein [Herpetosiphon llansteffanensis]|uniref:hypothetical protein n=1 Tax=Herpetosiphon llansteffanensis TaxID=2094568 RepID=UPI000D7C25B2|nr:hypothetical protein [Herpetosiphon llansteffanensis]
MARMYWYVGPIELSHMPKPLPSRSQIRQRADVEAWIAAQPRDTGKHQQLTATFIIDQALQLWLADQRSEHVVCARGAAVLAAGEISFVLEANRLIYCELTNQSTGYCPEPTTWTVVQQVLDSIGLPHAGAWATSYEFRRCPACAMLNLIKEHWFFCAVCEHELPRQWNCACLSSL